MFTFERIVLGMIVISLSCFGLVTNNVVLTPYIMLFLGFSILMTSLAVLMNKGNRILGCISILASLFVFFISIEGFLLK